jgi:hypothetical protein
MRGVRGCDACLESVGDLNHVEDINHFIYLDFFGGESNSWHSFLSTLNRTRRLQGVSVEAPLALELLQRLDDFLADTRL